jgi:hypothetical protein
MSECLGDQTLAEDDLPGIGQQLGRYLVLERVGAGSIGVVFAAWDPHLDRKVALKIVRRHSQKLGADEARLMREGQALATLSHPNVVAAYDVGAEGKSIFIAMEFVAGQSLRAWLGERRRSWTEVLAALRDAGRGLVAAHAVGIVHRDFKPDNVLVGRDGRVGVTDFGLALASPSEDAPPTGFTPDGSGASSDAPAGTAYMAPELLKGGLATSASDQYAFAVTAWEALFGRRPVPGSATAGNRGEGPSPVPPWIRRALARAMESDPALRHPSMEALLSALGRDPANGRRRRGLLATVAVTTALAAVGAGSFLRHRGAAPQPVADPLVRPTTLQARFPQLLDTDLRQRITVQREALTQIRARVVQGTDPNILLESARAATATPEAEGHPPLRAEALLVLAMVQNRRGDQPAAEESYREAGATALAYGDGERLAEAWTGLTEVMAKRIRPTDSFAVGN